MINELIDQIGGRERLEEFIRQPLANGLTRSEIMTMARALLAVLDGQENSTIRKRKALLWLERQKMAHPGMNEVRYAIDLITVPPAAIVPDGLAAAVNLLLDSDGSRGTFSAIRRGDALAEVERLLASAPAPGGDGG
ncbi:hypothetical protein CI789_02510 [Erwinia persicina]|uniref:hypothetical protein n=1 Tax=Erwinia persicina TaxID=55211 RepID=UPI000E46DA89|nr:hypothetical protein [Erwinia persicina]AXU94199.1 hypothetical protein CI789_02510 [Erwinia persicina]